MFKYSLPRQYDNVESAEMLFALVDEMEWQVKEHKGIAEELMLAVMREAFCDQAR